MNQEKQRINKDIKSRSVLLIDESGDNKGEVNTYTALKMAQDAGLDLVEVNKSYGVSVCRIMDYGKWKYEQTKRLKKNKSTKQGTKEIKFRPNTSENDLSYRAKQVSNFIKDGFKVKLSVRFKGREIAHMYHTGKLLLERFLQLIPGDFKMIGDAKSEDKSIVQWISNSSQ